MIPLSILIADDDAECRLALGDVLRHAGYHTWLVESGLRAVELIRRMPVRPHLAVLDFHMPDLTGLEVVRMLRAQQIVIPAIMITGDSSKELMLEALSAGAETVVHKPISPAVLTYAVQQVIQRRFRAQAPPPA